MQPGIIFRIKKIQSQYTYSIFINESICSKLPFPWSEKHMKTSYSEVLYCSFGHFFEKYILIQKPPFWSLYFLEDTFLNSFLLFEKSPPNFNSRSTSPYQRSTKYTTDGDKWLWCTILFVLGIFSNRYVLREKPPFWNWYICSFKRFLNSYLVFF